MASYFTELHDKVSIGEEGGRKRERERKDDYFVCCIFILFSPLQAHLLSSPVEVLQTVEDVSATISSLLVDSTLHSLTTNTLKYIINKS